MKRNLSRTPLPRNENPVGSPSTEAAGSTPLEHFEKLLTDDLHDSVCQSLAGTSFLVNLLCRQAEAGKAVAAADLQKVAGFLERAMDDLRALMSSDSLSAGGLTEALEKFALEMSRNTPRRLTIEAEDGQDDPRVTLILYRLARWAVRHAMKSTESVTIRVTRRQGTVTLEVQGADVAAFSDLPPDELAFLHQYARIAALVASIDTPGRILRIHSRPAA